MMSEPCLIFSLQTKTPGARLNATMCPHSPDLIAFVNSGDIWVTHLASRSEVSTGVHSGSVLCTVQCGGHVVLILFQVRLTHCHNASAGGVADDPLSAGLPSYVMQEEFNR